LVRVLEQVLGQAGVWLVAVDDPDAEDRARRPGRAGAGDTSAVADPVVAELAARVPRVLLVDDNAAMRRVLRGLLEDAGMDLVGEAGDGLQGVALAAAVRPDVVLMDWRMPELGGLEATARIRQ